MDFLKYLFDKFGLAGTLLIIFVLKEVGILDRLYKFLKIKKDDEEEPEREHRRSDDNGENHTHHRELEKNLQFLEEEFKASRLEWIAFKEKEALEEGRFIKLETAQIAQEKENSHLFKQHGILFEKIDKLDEKIDQRFLVINADIKAILNEMRK